MKVDIVERTENTVRLILQSHSCSYELFINDEILNSILKFVSYCLFMSTSDITILTLVNLFIILRLTDKYRLFLKI